MAPPVGRPKGGESIGEGTIVRGMKKAGGRVERDEPLFEISTDKVDAEIPSPAAGVLTDIKVKEGETVPVNSVVAEIGQPNEVRRPGSAEGEAVGRAGPADGEASEAGPAETGAEPEQQADGQSPPASTPADKTVSSIRPEPQSGNG